jgi:hypothetical protein
VLAASAIAFMLAASITLPGFDRPINQHEPVEESSDAEEAKWDEGGPQEHALEQIRIRAPAVALS